eukprot:COSAG06_NODE_1084_length_10770_cov_7.118077_2_plen_143_part_00
MIAIVLSMKDLGFTIATYYGAVLTTWAGIEENECGVTPFDNLWALYVWRIFCRLIPVLAVYLVPTEDQISEAMEKLVQADKDLAKDKSRRDGMGGLSESLAESVASDGVDIVDIVDDSALPPDPADPSQPQTTANPTAGAKS